MRFMLPVLGILALSCASAAVEGQSSWASLNGLRAGQKIQVTEKNSKNHSGTFVSVSESAIVILEAATERSIQMPDVRSVKLENKRRLRNTLIGAGVGGGAGAVTGAAIPSSAYWGSKGKAVALVGAAGAVVGIAIGGLLPTHGTVYNAETH